jgi:hypothetical protein
MKTKGQHIDEIWTYVFDHVQTFEDNFCSDELLAMTGKAMDEYSERCIDDFVVGVLA